MLFIMFKPNWRSEPKAFLKWRNEIEKEKTQSLIIQKREKKIEYNLNQRRKQVGQPSWRADPDAFNIWRLAMNFN